MSRPPVIFIGMHRSGTSMIGRLLEELGLYVGLRKDENNEALFFQKLNDWLLHSAGARWDCPDPFRRYFWPVQANVALAAEYLQNMAASPRALSYLGLHRYMQGGFRGLNGPWGWKDPRNTFTLPMWLRIFPDAKVIYIKRNGVDVAESLRVRERDILKAGPEFYLKWRFIFFLKPRKSGFAASPRCLDLEEGFRLWAEYLDEAERVLELVPATNVLRLNYEQILADPEPWIKQAADFCSLAATSSQISTVAATVLKDRSNAFIHSKELSDFSRSHVLELRAAGYL